MVEPLFRYDSPYSTQVDMTGIDCLVPTQELFGGAAITYLFPRKSTTGTRQP